MTGRRWGRPHLAPLNGQNFCSSVTGPLGVVIHLPPNTPAISVFVLIRRTGEAMQGGRELPKSGNLLSSQLSRHFLPSASPRSDFFLHFIFRSSRSCTCKPRRWRGCCVGRRAPSRVYVAIFDFDWDKWVFLTTTISAIFGPFLAILGPLSAHFWPIAGYFRTFSDIFGHFGPRGSSKWRWVA